MANSPSQQAEAHEANQHSKKARAEDDGSRDGGTPAPPPTVGPDPNYVPPSRGGDGDSQD